MGDHWVQTLWIALSIGLKTFAALLRYRLEQKVLALACRP